MNAAAAPLLELDRTSRRTTATIHALKGVSINVREGEIVTLIGANGAGKSTTLRSINGLNHPRKGTIASRAATSTNEPAHDIVRMGIAQSPEGRQRLPRMTVTENLEMGAFERRDKARDARRHGAGVRALPAARASAARRQAGTMSGGEQQMLRDRPGADGAADAAAARRAVDGPRADPGRAHLRDDRRGQQAGDVDPARRAERADGARGRDPRLRDRDRHRRPRRRSGRPRKERGRPQDVLGRI